MTSIVDASAEEWKDSNIKDSAALTSQSTSEEETATITEGQNKWDLENSTMRAAVEFENGSLKLTSFYNRLSNREFLQDSVKSYLFSYTYGEYIPGTVWSYAGFIKDGKVPSAASNPVTMKSDDGSWKLESGKTKVSDISASTEDGNTQHLGKQLELTVTNEENKFQVRLVFQIYDGMAGLHYQNYVKNIGDKKMVISESDVISLDVPDEPHYLHYVNAKSSSTGGGAENSTWKAVTGGLPANTGRNALMAYSGGDGWWIMPETNWRTQDGPDVSGSKNEGTKTFNEFATTSCTPEAARKTVKVACIGDSITEGVGSTSGLSYPSQLQSNLGPAFEVKNFGVSGTTLLKNTDKSYWDTSKYTDSKNYLPDVVIIMLGTNDSKQRYWDSHQNEYKSDFLDLISQYRSLSSNPTVIMATSPTVAADNLGITDALVTGKVVPLQREVADEAQCPLVEINELTKGQFSWYSTDGVHLNDLGYKNLAARFAPFTGSYQYPDSSSFQVKVSTNPQSLQLTLKPDEEFQYIGVNLTVFKGDVVDGKMSAEEHFQKRFQFRDTTMIFNTNDWDYRGKRSYDYYQKTIIPQAVKAKVDMAMLDDLWNTDRDSITAISSLKSLGDISSLISDAGLKFGVWFSLTGADHNGGRDLANPAKIAEKKEQIRTLIKDYHVSHEMIDLTEFWQNKTETAYSSPCDNVYRKNVLSNQMLNDLEAEYPQFLVKLTNEVDVYPTPGNRSNGLLQLVNNGWVVSNGGVGGSQNGIGSLAAGANSFGYLPLSTYYTGGPVNGSMGLYYSYMFARDVKLSEDPGGSGWTDHGVDLMATSNNWRKGERVKELTDQVKRPTYLGAGWNSNAGSDTGINGPYSWMYTSRDRSRALLIATDCGATPQNITADTRWLDKGKNYLAAEVSLNDDGQFAYHYQGVCAGADLTKNGFPINLTDSSSGGRAYWFEAVGENPMQVIYADENAVNYTETFGSNGLTVTATGTPGTVATLIVGDSENNKGRVCPIRIGDDGTAAFTVSEDQLSGPSSDNESSYFKPIRYEFESLYDTQKLSGSSSNVTFSASSTDNSPSGGRYGLIQFNAIGDSASLRINVPSTGVYDVKLAYKVNEKSAKAALGQNGQVTGDEVDQSVGALNTWKTQQATLTFDHAGDNDVQIFYTGKGSNPSAPSGSGNSIRVDYVEITLHTSLSPVVLEAEDLSGGASASGGGSLSVGSSPAASGGKLLKLTSSSAGALVTLPISAKDAGNYTVALNYMTGNDGAKFQYLENGDPVGDTADGYVSSGNAIKSMSLGNYWIDAGQEKNLSFLVTSRAISNTTGYNMYLDSVTLTPSATIQVSSEGGILENGAEMNLNTVFSVINMLPIYCVPETLKWKVMSESDFNVATINDDGLLSTHNPGTIVVRGINKYDSTIYHDYTLTVVGSELDHTTRETIVKINQIGKVTAGQECADKIEAAEALYASLSGNQKTQVSNYYLLKSARYEFDSLQSGSGKDPLSALVYVEDIPFISDGTSVITPKVDSAGNGLQYLADGTVYQHGFGFEPPSDATRCVGTMLIPVPEGVDRFYTRVGLAKSSSTGDQYDEKNTVTFKLDGNTKASVGPILKNYKNGQWDDQTKEVGFSIPAGSKWLLIENDNGGSNHSDHILFADTRLENTQALNVISLINAISPAGVNISEFTVETAQKIDAAEQAYFALDTKTRDMVSNRSLMISDRQTHAQFGIMTLSDGELKNRILALNHLIESLPPAGNLKFNDLSSVRKARANYQLLTTEQRYYVGDINTMIASEEFFATFSEEDTQEAIQVISLMDALPSAEQISAEDGPAITAVRAAYTQLKPELRVLVDDSSLLAAEAAYRALEGTDSSSLRNLYESNKSRSAQEYTSSSWNSFQSALVNAKSVLDSGHSSQEALDAAYSALLLAIQGLVEKTPNSSGSQSKPRPTANPSGVIISPDGAGGFKATVGAQLNAAPAISAEHKVEAAFKVTDEIAAAISAATAENPLKVDVTVPVESVAEQLRQPAAHTANLTIQIPSEMADLDNQNVRVSIHVAPSLLQAAKETQKDITVNVTDRQTGKTLYVWAFSGNGLKKSIVPVSELDLALSVTPLKNQTPVYAALAKNSAGLLVKQGQNGLLPTPASVRIYVGNQAGFAPHSAVYLYRVNQGAGILEQLPVLGGEVSTDGYVSFTITHGTEYVLLTQPTADTYPVKSDTTYPLAIPKGGTYTFAIAVHGNAAPNLVIGNGKAFVSKVKKKGNQYLVTVTSTGTPGEMTALYSTLPGGKPVIICYLGVATTA